MRKWLKTLLGQSFIKAEQQVIETFIPTLFGYELLWIGEPDFYQCVKHSPISHHTWINLNTVNREYLNPIKSRADKLPILSDSIDLIYLAHGLEFTNNPHEVLRETGRVLIPEGHLIITGFNPWSLWGLWRYCTHYFKPLPWDGQFIAVEKLKDWLGLLGFEVLQVKEFFIRPPFTNEKLLKRTEFIENLPLPRFLGKGGYAVFAKKQVIPLTPIRTRWQTEEDSIGTSLVEQL